MTIDPEIWEEIQDICYSEGISVSELANQLFKEKIEKVRKIEREREELKREKRSALIKEHPKQYRPKPEKD